MTPKIFVIDDDEAVQDSLRVLLESLDLEVETFGSGREFLERHDDRATGCVVLDIDLPSMNGLEVLAALSERGEHLPVILMTGRADPLLRKQSKQSKAVALLEKPMRESQLLDSIAEALNTERQRSR